MKSCFKPCHARFWMIVFTVVVVYLLVFFRPQTVIVTHPSTLMAFGCSSTDSDPIRQCCPNQDKPLDLVNFNLRSAPTFSTILRLHPDICGGQWRPTHCRAQQNVAILIPYRDRELHLRILLYRLHSLLRLQQLAYSIYVIEQTGDTSFNRGLLMNIGIRESLRRDPSIECFIFHDVDMLPENSENLYMCDSNLRHLASGVDEFRFHVPFANYAGGVTALSRINALSINGFPNRYWGWGNEDDELAARAFLHGLKLSRPPEYIGRYHTFRHVKASRGSGHYKSFIGYRGYRNDGLSSLFNSPYRIIDNEEPTNGSRNVTLSSNFSQCALKYFSERFGINVLQPYRDQGFTHASDAVEGLTIDALARTLLYTHIKVDVTAFNAKVIKPVEITQESLFWFLRFYGWF